MWGPLLYARQGDLSEPRGGARLGRGRGTWANFSGIEKKSKRNKAAEARAGGEAQRTWFAAGEARATTRAPLHQAKAEARGSGVTPAAATGDLRALAVVSGSSSRSSGSRSAAWRTRRVQLGLRQPLAGAPGIPRLIWRKPERAEGHTVGKGVCSPRRARISARIYSTDWHPLFTNSAPGMTQFRPARRGTLSLPRPQPPALEFCCLRVASPGRRSHSNFKTFWF